MASRIFGRLSDFGNGLADIVAPLDEDDDYGASDGLNDSVSADLEEDKNFSRVHNDMEEKLNDKTEEISRLHTEISELKKLLRVSGERYGDCESCKAREFLEVNRDTFEQISSLRTEIDSIRQYAAHLLRDFDVPEVVTADGLTMLHHIDDEMKRLKSITIHGAAAESRSELPANVDGPALARLRSELEESTLRCSEYRGALKIFEVKTQELALDIEAEKSANCALEMQMYQLKEVISQLRKSKNVRGQEVEVVIRERDELMIRTTTLLKEVTDLTEQNKALIEYKHESEARIQDNILLEERLKNSERTASSQYDELQKSHDDLRHKFFCAQQLVHDANSKLQVCEADLEVVRADNARSFTSLKNLQRVLENFQSEKDIEMKRLEQKYQLEIESLEMRSSHLTRDVDDAKAATSSEVKALREDVQRMTRNLTEVQNGKDAEVQGMRRTLDLAIEQLQASTQEVVDRNLMQNLVVQYHQKNRSSEVLELMARILGLSEDQKAACGLHSRRPLLTGIRSLLPAPDLAFEVAEGSNLVELWVKFLETESKSTRNV
jgi:chromosome segregation ATPase